MADAGFQTQVILLLKATPLQQNQPLTFVHVDYGVLAGRSKGDPLSSAYLYP